MSERRTRSGSVFGEPFLSEEEVAKITKEEKQKEIEKANRKIELLKEKAERRSLNRAEQRGEQRLDHKLSETDSELSEGSDSSQDKTVIDLQSLAIDQLQTTQFFEGILSGAGTYTQANTAQSVGVLPGAGTTQSNMAEAEFSFSKFHKAIPEFSGTIAELNRFIACCDLFYDDLTNDAHSTSFLKALVKKFTGRAFDFYAKETWSNWPALKSALKKYFSSSQSFEGY